MKNYNCDNDKCISAHGEIRVLPTGPTIDKEGTKSAFSSSIALLCRACYEHEMQFRRERNKELSQPCAFKLPAWEALKVYNPGE